MHNSWKVKCKISSFVSRSYLETYKFLSFSDEIFKNAYNNMMFPTSLEKEKGLPSFPVSIVKFSCSNEKLPLYKDKK